MTCEILDKWHCNLCLLKDDPEKKVITCHNYDQESTGCGMPILVTFVKEKQNA